MTSKRVSAPADLMSEFDDDDAAAQIYRSTGGNPIQIAFKQPTFTPTQTLRTACPAFSTSRHIALSLMCFALIVHSHLHLRWEWTMRCIDALGVISALGEETRNRSTVGYPAGDPVQWLISQGLSWLGIPTAVRGPEWRHEGVRWTIRSIR